MFIIIVLCAVVGFLTFGLTQAFCGTAPTRVRFGGVRLNQTVILGKVYDISRYNHPVVPGYINSSRLADPANNAGGRDLTFLFPSVSRNCKKWFKPVNDSEEVDRIFPCTQIDLLFPGTPNPTADAKGLVCHYSSVKKIKYIGELYFDWDDITRKDRNYTVFNG